MAQIARIQNGELGDDHPVTKVLRSFESKIMSGTKDNRDIDQALIVANLDKINQKLEGRLATYPYNGKIVFYYEEGGKPFFLEVSQEDQKPKIILSSEEPPWHKRRGGELSERFSPNYPGLTVVGYERAYDGNIVPILASSNRLSEFRDMSGYSGGFMFNPASHEALAREIIEVPLIPIRAKTRSSLELPHDFPSELSDLIKSDMTLTTLPSLQGLSERNIVSKKVPTFAKWSAMVIGSHDGQGRTGVLLKNGAPVLIKNGGKEYFLELKGIGLASSAPRKELIHSRQAGNIRLGRMNVDQVDREMAANSNLDSVFFDENDAPKPLAGIQLPEFSFFEMVHGDDRFSKARPEAKDLSGQVYRLASTTRRMAYADNSAYGPRYTKKSDLLGRAQYAYGKLFAELRFKNLEQPLEHHSPHPQNFTVSYDGRRLGVTDLSDIHPVEKWDVDHARAPALRDLAQYSIFKNLAGQNNFLSGIKEVIEKQGLWTNRLEDLFQNKVTGEKFRTILREEVIIPLHVKSRDLRSLVPTPPISGNYHLMAVVKGDAHALYSRGEFLEIAVRHSIKGIDTDIREFESLVNSTPLQASKTEELKLLSKTVERLKKVRSELKAFYKEQASQNWTSDTKTIARFLFGSMEQQATVADELSIMSGKSPSYYRNKLRKSDVADYLSQP